MREMPRRVAAVAVLLAVTVIGIRAHGTFSRAPDLAAAGATGTVLAIALASCEGVALVAFVIVLVSARPRRVQPDTEEPERLPFPWWAKPLGVLLAVVALAAPLAVLFTKVREKTSAVPSLAHPGSPVSGSQKLTAPAPGSAWPLIAGLVIAIAVVLTLALMARRKRLVAQPRNQVSRFAEAELLYRNSSVIVDGAAAATIRAKRIACAIVGADRIALNGDTANKIGTYGVAIAAAHHGIPFYVAAPRSTIDFSLANGEGMAIEERAPDEVRSFAGARSAPSEIDAYNPAFDVTPGHLIAGIVTEYGVARPPYAESLPELAYRPRFPFAHARQFRP